MNSQDGATLVEALAFTVVAILFVVSATALYSMLSSSSDAAAIETQLNSMQNEIHKLFRRQPTYDNLTPSLVIEAEALPENLRVDGSTVRHTFGAGEVQFGAARGLGSGISSTAQTGDGASGRRFTITYTSLPQELCIQVLNRVSSQFNQADLLDSGGNLIGGLDDMGNSIGAFSDSNGLPLDIAEAEANCVENAQLRYYSN